jgi:hypothetical protein
MAETVKESEIPTSVDNDALLGRARGVGQAKNFAATNYSFKPRESKLEPVNFVAPELPRIGTAGEAYEKAMKAPMLALQTAEEKKLKEDADKQLAEIGFEATKQKKLADSSAKQRLDILDDPSRAEYRKALDDKAKPFIPHEENAQDMVMLFGLMNVLGFAIGAGGKEYSQVAMSAMNGMLEGHQKGRDDLYKKEKSIFETNQKQLDSRIKQLMAFMQDTELLSGMDKTARDQKIQGEFLQQNATFLKDFYEKRGYGPTLELMKKAVDVAGTINNLTQKEIDRAAQQSYDLKMESQKATEARQVKADERADAYDRMNLQLTEASKAAEKSRDFELARDLQNRNFDIAKAKDTMKHSEELFNIQKKWASEVELARIEREKAKDISDAAYRAADQTWRQKIEGWHEEDKKARQKYEDRKLAEDSRHDQEIERLRALEIAAKGGGIGKLDREVYNIATKNYAGIDPKDLTNLSKESVGRIVNGTKAIEEVEDIAAFIKKNPGASGAAAKFRNLINYDSIKSITGESETTADIKRQAIDSQIDDAISKGKLTEDDAKNAKLLSKKLFTLALTDVQASGQRGSVYLDKAFQGLFDQASRPGTLIEILADRASQANRNLANFDMEVQNRKDSNRFDLTTKGGEQWMNENFPMVTAKELDKRMAPNYQGPGKLKVGDYIRTTTGEIKQILK